MEDPCPLTRVEQVQEVVQSMWFQDALQEPNIAAILVLAHMDVNDPLVTVLLQAIRSTLGQQFPVQFITGHTHYRGFLQLDDYATSFEAGRYLDTIGFVSFPSVHTTTDENLANTNTNTSDLFHHVFLDTNVKKLRKEVLDMRFSFQFFTTRGRQLQQLIYRTRHKLGLHNQIACHNETLLLENGLQESQSLWGFYRQNVVNSFLFQNDPTKVLFQNQGSFRYDLFKGRITLDDVIAVAPFNDTIYKIAADLTGAQLLQVLGHEPNTDLNPAAREMSKLPHTIVSVDSFDSDAVYELYTVDFELQHWTDRVNQVLSGNTTSTTTTTTTTTVTPEPLNWTITLLWRSYAETYMTGHCPRPNPIDTVEEEAEGRSLSTIIVGSIMIVVALLSVFLCLGIILRRIMRFAGYSSMATSNNVTTPSIRVTKAVEGFDEDDMELI
eukprot:CAMPEP_0116549110 /NCGR_PEP_ID=MMETSP0397-20121206/4700_1 /TAXON_ID=216820 /ORGANISM="Cyclophora tenuis, Strain ECT3854" /LENGTH=438 /DNA_ID=CAMNT_0004073815 /DNA_START=132 /DNA_END=1448 /DNA_ORIENTATION=+